MGITIKSAEEFEKMRIAGKLAADVLTMIEQHVAPGVTTNTLNDICHDYITHVQNAIPAPLNYKGYPKSICTSVNHVVCHGIPNNKPLKKGDIVNIDVTVIKNGYHGDTSKMFFVGEPNIQARRLTEVTRACLVKAIQRVKPGIRLGDIGHTIQQYAESHHYSVVRDFCGHGIGTEFHEDPQVLHYGQAGRGHILEAGMCFTIEPMLNVGKHTVKIRPDGWTAVTKDRSLSAQWEHTIGITENGYEVFTRRAEETDL